MNISFWINKYILDWRQKILTKYYIMQVSKIIYNHTSRPISNVLSLILIIHVSKIRIKLQASWYLTSYLCYLYKYTTFFRFCNRQNTQSFADFLYKITKKIPLLGFYPLKGEVYHLIATLNIGGRYIIKLQPDILG